MPEGVEAYSEWDPTTKPAGLQIQFDTGSGKAIKTSLPCGEDLMGQIWQLFGLLMFATTLFTHPKLRISAER